MSLNSFDTDIPGPDKTFIVRDLFGLDSDMSALGFGPPSSHVVSSHGPSPHVPLVDEAYCFDPPTTLAIVAGLKHNRHVFIQGRHGSGKSTHIEQVCARLNWPCVRINLDGHIGRMDLVGKEAIVISDGKQITQFKPGIIPWCLTQPIVLVLDEYDAGRPDVMFVIQRLLEDNGRFSLLETNQILTPHPGFRLFATANTVGLGDGSGMYQGTQSLNQGQLDRWHMTIHLDYLAPERERALILTKKPHHNTAGGKKIVRQMINMANLTREGVRLGDVSTMMSPRTILSWVDNFDIFADLEIAFRLSFFNRCDEDEKLLIAEYYQRCFDVELPELAFSKS